MLPRNLRTGWSARQAGLLALLLAALIAPPGRAATTNVTATASTTFSPSSVTIKPNDTVQWTWTGNNHSTTSTSVPSLWDSGIHNAGFTFSFTFPNQGNFPYHCSNPLHSSMTGSVVVTNRPPVVTVTNPPNNSVFTAPANFSLGATASDPDGAMSQVEFFRGSVSLGVDTTSPYGINVTSLGVGSYTFSAVATGDGGGKTTNAINVTVNAANTPPTVTVTNPANGSVFNAPATFTVGATASDSDGSVTNVQFFRGATSIANDTTSPYSAAVTSLGAGAYTFSAVASDNGGARTTNSINLTVNALPSVTVTNPANGAVFNAPAAFTLAAAASDTDGSISQVEFFRGTTSIGIDTTSPYSAAVTNLVAGTYAFAAVATDNNGGKTTNSIAVTVNALPAVTITNPPAGATFAEPWTGPIVASAGDSDGSIARVQFFSDALPLGIVSNSPYSLGLTNLAAGIHVLTAVAMDNRGATNTSAPVSISVVTPVPIVLSDPAWVSPIQFRFTYTANTGLTYVVERASDLTVFSILNTNTASSTNVIFTDGAATNDLNFYRVGRLPNP